MKTGKINVQTENIFPIIKKFLYSDHEIFLRELISNAVDATQKMKTLVSLGKANVELGDLTIRVKVEKADKTIRIIDKGIGMTAEEVERYINQIAFSGAEEFLETYKGSDAANMIGHFGLGFYSAFMVADRVDIITKSYMADKPAVKWSCDGSPDFSMEETDKIERGTEIVLHLAEDAQAFLDEYKIVDLLKKYARFLPVEIQCGMEKKWIDDETVKDEKDESKKKKEIEVPRIINNVSPLWKLSPSNITEEQYTDFYHELYPMSFETPLFHIHLNVDYPFNLTGILYFPKIRNQLEIQKNKVQLYSNQVFITDQMEGVIPEFMMLLHGVIDSPDIPLNVSRSYLQSDAGVKKISTHITKKVADKLEEIFKNNREDFEKKWDDLSVFIQYGCLSDELFYDRAKTFYLLKNTENQYYTLEEYKNKVQVLQKDKHNNVIYLYATNAEEQSLYIRNAKERGYDVLLMSGFLDVHFINLLEQKLENTRFVRVDADIVDKLIEKDEILPTKWSEEEQKKLKECFESLLDSSHFSVRLENLSETDMPVMITQNEFMRRYTDMEKISGQKSMFGMSGMENYQLIVNSNHPLAQRLIVETDTTKKNELTQQLIDIALLSQNLLKGDKLSDFLRRSVDMM
jgi:molecular chaperone HtpG